MEEAMPAKRVSSSILAGVVLIGSASAITAQDQPLVTEDLSSESIDYILNNMERFSAEAQLNEERIVIDFEDTFTEIILPDFMEYYPPLPEDYDRFDRNERPEFLESQLPSLTELHEQINSLHSK